MVDIATEPKRLDEVVLYEADRRLSRKNAIIASGAGALKIGAVLGAITASGKFVAYDPDGVDGSETAKAILVTDADATAADAEAVVITALAVVADAGLEWAAGVDAAEQTAALAALEVAHIRTAPVN